MAAVIEHILGVLFLLALLAVVVGVICLWMGIAALIMFWGDDKPR